MQEQIGKINAEMAAFNEDAQLQSEKANKAAGTRARKSTLNLEKLLKEFRKISLEESKK
ncbi:MAG: histone H1 [Myroides sp.]